jgi:O-antigen/teichoic acid export membrane protein
VTTEQPASVADAAVPRRRTIARLARRAGWNVADQALSSASNLALALLVARAVDSEAFGAFTVSFTVYSVAVLCSRAVVSQPLMVRFSGAAPDRFRGAAGASTGAATALGIVLGVLVLGAGLAIGGGVGIALQVMALLLPGLLLQDAWRMAFFAQRRPELATLLDAVWIVLQFAAVAVFLAVGTDSIVPFVLAWGVAAAVAGVLGVRQGRTPPRVRATFSFLRAHWDLTGYLLFESLLLQGAYQGALLLAGAFGTLSDVGSLRGAQVVLGPMTLLATSAVAFGIPELSRRGYLSARSRTLVAAGLGGLLAVIGLVWGALMLLMPEAWGEALLGDSWDGVRAVLFASLVGQVANLISVGPSCVVHAMGKSASTFRIHAAVSAMLIVFGMAGLWAGGAVGAAYGFAVAYWAVVPFWFLTLNRLARAAERAGTPGSGTTA